MIGGPVRNYGLYGDSSFGLPVVNTVGKMIFWPVLRLFPKT